MRIQLAALTVGLVASLAMAQYLRGFLYAIEPTDPATLIADDSEIIIIGSQAILGTFPDAPAELLVSMEADVYPKNRPERSDLIDEKDLRFTTFTATMPRVSMKPPPCSPTGGRSVSCWCGTRTRAVIRGGAWSLTIS